MRPVRASIGTESESAITIGVTATSQDGSSSTQSFAIAVTDVDEFDVTPGRMRNAAANTLPRTLRRGRRSASPPSPPTATATTNGVTYSLANDAGGGS